MMANRVYQSLEEREVFAAMESGSTVPSATATSNDLQSSGGISSSTPPPADAVVRLSHAVSQRQHLLLYRWIACVIVVLIFAVREDLVAYLGGGGFRSDEFRPFVRCLSPINQCLLLLLLVGESVNGFGPTVVVYGNTGPIQTSSGAALSLTQWVSDVFSHDRKLFRSRRSRLRLTIVKTVCIWFIGVDPLSGISQLEPDISMKISKFLHDGHYSRFTFGEGIGYKFQKVFWRLGRRIWDPGKTDLWRRHESEQEIMYWYNLYWYNLSLIRRQSKSWTKTTIKIHVISWCERYWIRLRCNRWIAIFHLLRQNWLVITMMIAIQDDHMRPRTMMDKTHNGYGYLFAWKSSLTKRATCNCSFSILKFCLSNVSIVFVVFISLIPAIVNFGSF
uniref:Protein RER1C n=1 Tax=Noccaea caerulescens TaxID=107243 RepID=A0A1J3H8R3_NOCCA